MPTFAEDVKTAMWLLFRIRRKSLVMLLLFYLLPIGYVFTQTGNLIGSPFAEELGGYAAPLVQSGRDCPDCCDLVVAPAGEAAERFVADFFEVASRHYAAEGLAGARVKYLESQAALSRYLTERRTLGSASAGFYLSLRPGGRGGRPAAGLGEGAPAAPSGAAVERVYVYVGEKLEGAPLIPDAGFAGGLGLPIQLILEEMKLDAVRARGAAGARSGGQDLQFQVLDVAEADYGLAVGSAASYTGTNYVLVGIAEITLLGELKAGNKTLYLGLFGLGRRAYALAAALFFLLEASVVLLVQLGELYFLACFGTIAGYGGPVCSGLNPALPALAVAMSVPSVVALCGVWLSFCSVACSTNAQLFLAFLLPVLLGTVGSIVVANLGALGWAEGWVLAVDALGVLLPPVNLFVFTVAAAEAYRLDINSALLGLPRPGLGELVAKRLGLGAPSLLETLLVSLLSAAVYAPLVDLLLRFGSRSGFPRQTARRRPREVEEGIAMEAAPGGLGPAASRGPAASPGRAASPPREPGLDGREGARSALDSDSVRLLGPQGGADAARAGSEPRFLLSSSLLYMVYPRAAASLSCAPAGQGGAAGGEPAPEAAGETFVELGFGRDPGRLRVEEGQRAALRDLTLNLEQGKIYALVGKNGSGKTTFLNLVLGLAAPPLSREDARRGVRRLRVAWPSPSAPGGLEFLYPAEAPHRLYAEALAVVLQSDVVFSLFTVREQMELMSRVVFGRVAPERIAEALADMGLEDCASQRIDRLSGGQRRRLSIAYALLKVQAGAGLLLLDEPSCGIDVKSRVYLARYLFRQRARRAAEGRPFLVLLTTHLLEEAEELADEMVIFRDGRLHAMGSQVFLKLSYAQGYTILVERLRGPEGGAAEEAGEGSGGEADPARRAGEPRAGAPADIPASVSSLAEAQALVRGLDPDSQVSALVSWIARSRGLSHAAGEIRVPFAEQGRIPEVAALLREVVPRVSFSIQCPSLNDVFLRAQEDSAGGAAGGAGGRAGRAAAGGAGGGAGPGAPPGLPGGSLDGSRSLVEHKWSTAQLCR